MGRIAIDQVRSGMLLADDVRSYNGRLLLAAGLELEQKHLTILRTWGVQELTVAGAEGPEQAGPALPATVDPEQLETARQELRPLFALADLEHPVLAELLRLAALRKVQS